MAALYCFDIRVIPCPKKTGLNDIRRQFTPLMPAGKSAGDRFTRLREERWERGGVTEDEDRTQGETEGRNNQP
jgi:hypothetical protein